MFESLTSMPLEVWVLLLLFVSVTISGFSLYVTIITARLFLKQKPPLSDVKNVTSARDTSTPTMNPDGSTNVAIMARGVAKKRHWWEKEKPKQQRDDQVEDGKDATLFS